MAGGFFAEDQGEGGGWGWVQPGAEVGVYIIDAHVGVFHNDFVRGWFGDGEGGRVG